MKIPEHSDINVTDESVLKTALSKLESPKSSFISGTSHNYWFIFNPAANKGRAGKQLEWLSDGLKKFGCDTVIQVTTEPNEATQFSEMAKKSVDVIVACGGDGTINEVIQPMVGTDTVLGCLPIGSANDFIKNISTCSQPETHLSKLFKSPVQKVDIGKVSYTNGSTNQTRYFLNSFGLGFSGQIAKEAKSISWAKGDLSYAMALLKVASDYQPQRLKFRLHTPDEVLDYDEEIFMLSIGNGKVEAGKFMIAPHAEINDGLLDVCILKEISRKQLPKWIGKYIKGTQINESEVIYAQVTKLEIDIPKPEVLHLDGEVLDNVHDKLIVEVCPSSLNVLASKDQH